MKAEEYIKIFREILVLTEKLEELCKRKKFDDIDEPFNKRDELFNKLDELPEDITKEDYQVICEIKDKLTEKNQFIMKAFQVHKNNLKMDLALMNKENKIVEAYKIPSTINKSSIFDSRE